MHRYEHVFIPALATASALLLSSASAFAYSYNESPDGDPVRWLQPRVSVVLDASLSRLGDVDEIRDTMEEAFDVWTENVELPFEVEFVDGECGAAGAKNDGVSCIFVEGTAPPDHAEAGATTYVKYLASTGAISEADVIFYEESGPWSTDGSEGALDVFAVASHEIGHLFGLGHSDIATARMFPTVVTGDQWEGELDEDDISGAKALYEGVELDDAAEAMSCTASVAPGRSGAAASFLMMLLLVGLIYLRKNRP
jgi:hypothetical protein